MKSTPVICGIDIGSWTVKISVFNGEKFEVLTNEANFRETPALVGYTATERLIGQAAMIKLKSNYANTIRAPQRLLGLQRHQHLLEQELKYQKVKYSSTEDLVFSVEGKLSALQVSVEEVLISLIGKIKSIIQTHNLTLSKAYIAIPTYTGHEQRISLKRCAEIGLGRPVKLVDDWIALSCQYTYSRIKQLKTLDEMRHVIFMDIGYSKVSLSLVQFSRFSGRLLDWQYLPYTGCKNMDHLLAQFYDDLFQRQHKQSIIKHPKAFIKLADAVQRQRTVLSANNEHHLNLQYLLADQDLIYNMTREELQTIVIPVLADMAAAMAAIQSRNCSLTIHAIELVGGASRIPCIQSMAAKIFGLQPSRTLNQSEALVIGSAVFGAFDIKLLNLQFTYQQRLLKQIGVRWGKQQRQVFSNVTLYPTQMSLNIGDEGVINMVIFIDPGVAEKQIGRLRFKTPNKVTFMLDENRILSVKLAIHSFELCDLRHKAETKWKSIQQREEHMLKADMRMNMIYQMKNDYESKLYWCKNRYEELKNIATQAEANQIQEHIKMASHWIEEEHHQHGGGSQSDLQQFQLKMNEITQLKNICQVLQGRRKKTDELKVRYDKLGEEISMALQLNLSEKGRQKVLQIMSWGQQAYQQMQNHNWMTDHLTIQKLSEASVIIRTSSNL